MRKIIFIVHLSELYCKRGNKKALFSLVRAKMIGFEKEEKLISKWYNM